MPFKPRQRLLACSSLLLSAALGCSGPAPEQDPAQALSCLSAPGLPPGLAPSLVKDIHAPTPWMDQGSWVDSPGAPVSAGSTLYFLARESNTGNDLWLTDGTQQGTRLVADIVPGINSSGITGLAALGNTVFVSMEPSVYNGTMWVTEGVPGSTRPFDRESYWRNPGNLITCNGALFFQDYDAAENTWKGLWKSDGTRAGTVQLSQGEWWHDPSGTNRFVCANGTLFFVGHLGPFGDELWKSDGTAAGTQLLGNLGPIITPQDGTPLLFAAGSRVFTAGTFSGGLWTSDGTPEGTTLLRSDSTEDRLSNAQSLTPVGDTLYFVARDSQYRQGLWTSDGTEEGTRMILELPWEGPPPPALVSLGDTLLFSAGHTLYRSNGTPEGTVRLEIPSLTLDGREGAARLPDGRWIVLASTDGFNEPYSPWVTDGTGAGTARLQPASVPSFMRIRDLTRHGNQVLFWADDYRHGMEPWVTDGTPEGTRLLRDIFRDDSSRPESLVDVDGTLFFTAYDATHGRELWKSDGTAEGTVLLADTYPLLADFGPNNLMRVGQLLFLTTPKQVWRSDGTQAGTFPVFSPPGNVGWGGATGSLGSAFFFTHYNSASGLELWRSDGTPEGTGLFKDITPGPRSSMGGTPMVQLGTTLFFTAEDGIHGRELWKTDGTPEGTVLVKDIWPGGVGSSILSPLVNAGGTLFFVAHDGVHGWELWKSDGTAEGTRLVKDIHLNNANYPLGLVARGGTVVFVAHDGVHGNELWKSDGTPEGTQLVADIAPGLAAGISPYYNTAGAPLRVIGDAVYFAANDGVHGMELWKSDGTAAGTTLLRELTPGAAGSDLQGLAIVPAGPRGTFAFAAPDATGGRELWRSDGTTEGTWPLYDIAPGAPGSAPSRLTVSGSRLFFVADDGEHGQELWSVKQAAFQQRP